MEKEATESRSGRVNRPSMMSCWAPPPQELEPPLQRYSPDDDDDDDDDDADDEDGISYADLTPHSRWAHAGGPM